ncbi:hypothetical protein BEL04_17505 [Mucilaginibacter sp. PPCGB 2223]|uniref:ankyrin repeat domain-containing protein n=1 Tax=Mucilaginibacter sp. PPCGB 2223 TaxID=1886027 RepID=UPI000825A873|nr:ankyrin repeat domain-containing protein [Mucilaginibacter sp. PPCGB 2223]OCX51808.1 hypothetical protein BEL04_17505 [Mucilaginibacter sp. PPCGB 2223]
MIQPPELRLHLPKEVGGKQIATTTEVWQILQAAHDGDLEKIRELSEDCHGLLYAQYNYAPPIHFAVREGHTEVVRYLLAEGAHDPDYHFYPFQETMQTVARDRGYHEIADMLDDYAQNGVIRYTGDNGRIFYERTPEQTAFEKAVGQNQLAEVKAILADHPEFASDHHYFWSEGILLSPVKLGNFEMAELLMAYGATVPNLLKWAQFYYFETYAHAEWIMARGMNPNTMSWQRVTILHDMAQKGYLDKAKLLIRHGAELDSIDEAYRSTPLGLASRWGQREMVSYLLEQGADPQKAGAHWATPLAWAESKGHYEIAELLKRSL